MPSPLFFLILVAVPVANAGDSAKRHPPSTTTSASGGALSKPSPSTTSGNNTSGSASSTTVTQTTNTRVSAPARGASSVNSSKVKGRSGPRSKVNVTYLSTNTFCLSLFRAPSLPFLWFCLGGFLGRIELAYARRSAPKSGKFLDLCSGILWLPFPVFPF